MRTSLAEGVTLRRLEDGDARVEGRARALSLRHPPAGVLAVFEALTADGLTPSELASVAGGDAVQAYYWLGLAEDAGLLRWTVEQDGEALVTLSPASSAFRRHRAAFDEERPFQLSRFASSRIQDGDTLLECPPAHATVRLHDRRAAALLFDLGRPVTLADLLDAEDALEADTVEELVRLLAETGVLVPEGLDASGASPETQAALRQWEPHDLLFHARSRGWGLQARAGATYRFQGALPPPPALKPPMSAETVDLFRPDLASLKAHDAPFTDVLERRRSIRERAPEPLTVRQLGELLFRSARVRALRPGGEHGDLSDRPYPAAGALYELELYPLIDRCDGLAPGVYHYDPLAHRLERLSGLTAEAGALLDEARSPTEPFERPDLLLVLAARVPRVAWKYEAIAYALVMQDAGVLVQTLYLVATAMSLAPYALGRSDPDLFRRVTGTDGYAEVSVGAFAVSGLGTAARPPGSGPAPVP